MLLAMARSHWCEKPNRQHHSLGFYEGHVAVEKLTWSSDTHALTSEVPTLMGATTPADVIET
jgi:hypothetical protein